MEQHIKESMNPTILEGTAKLYEIDMDTIIMLDGFENFVYEFQKNGVKFILRLVHSDHKTYEQVEAEIEFIDYLDHFGACVSTVIHSKHNQIVEKVTINDKDYFSVTAFIKGLGDKIKEQANSDFFWENFGRQVGLFHKLTKTYQPIHKRPIWHDDALYHNAPKYLLPDHKGVLKALNQITMKIDQLDKHVDNFGLIHTDLHFGNIVIDENDTLTFFDFDDSCYKHFISDIAIVLFYQSAFSEETVQARTKKSIRILKPFMKGYLKENHLDIKEFEQLNLFLKLREITLYAAILSSAEQLSEDDWVQWYFKTYYKRIVNDTPFLDMDDIMEWMKQIYNDSKLADEL